MGFVMTRIIVTVILFLVITPIGFVRCMLGKDAFRQRRQPDAHKYWDSKKDAPVSPSQMEKYFYIPPYLTSHNDARQKYTQHPQGILLIPVRPQEFLTRVDPQHPCPAQPGLLYVPGASHHDL